MKGWLQDERESQLQLAKEFTHHLYNELKPYVENGKLAALETYLACGDESFEGLDYDVEAMELAVVSELEADSLVAIQRYTDWQLCRMVKSNDFTVLPFYEIDNDIAEGVNPSLMERVIGYMHSQEELPFLGKIEKGKFRPDAEIFQNWKNMYEWGW